MSPLFAFRDMKRKNEVLYTLLEPVVTGLGYELWGIEMVGSGANSILRVYIDKATETGVDVDDCQKVSQQIVGVLDVEDPIKGQYALEVSSPGLDRIIFNEQQFQNFKGETIKLQLREKLEGRRRLKGLLKDVAEEAIDVEIEDESKIYTIAFNNIESARLVPEF